MFVEKAGALQVLMILLAFQGTQMFITDFGFEGLRALTLWNTIVSEVQLHQFRRKAGT